MRYNFLTLILLIFIFACSETKTRKRVDPDFGFEEKVETLRKNPTIKNGVYKRYHEKKVLAEVAHYKNDTLDGQRILFYENGDTMSIETHLMGNFHGPFYDFHENGTLRLEMNYIDNKIEGKSKAYYDNGQLKEIVTFVANEEVGPFIEYHSNGKLKAEGNYIDGGLEQGELLLYDLNGKLEKKMDCKKGICYTTWTPEKP